MRVRNAVLADDDLGVDARRVDVAEDARDPAERGPHRRRPPRNLDGHHLAGSGAGILSRLDDDIHQHAAIEWHDMSHAVLAPIVAADDRTVGALEDTQDAPFGASTVFETLDARDDAIAVHRFVEMRAGNINVAAGVERTLGNHEAVPRRMRLQPAGVKVHLLGQAEPMTTDVDELAVRDERFDMPLERRLVVERNFEQLEQLPHTCGMVHALAHEREHLIARKHISWNLG